MGKFKETCLYPKLKDLCNCYLRYIDDIFIIWTGTKHQFEELISDINNCHPTIKFDYEIHATEVNFLDTTVFKDGYGKLKTKLYKKPTDRQNYLHIKSEHPPTLKKSIPYSQALRIRKICPDEKDLKENCEQLALTFQQRGYEKNFIKQQIDKAINIPRENLLTENPKEPSKRIPLSIKYNRTLPPISSIINKHWNLLQIDNDIKNEFIERPVIAYKRNKNLKEMIGSNIIEDNVKVTPKVDAINERSGKCQPCYGKAGNLCCIQLKNTKTFKSDNTKRTYKIFNDVNCKSENLIYLMECTLCEKKQYVGKCE